jgi:hypothetical protein
MTYMPIIRKKYRLAAIGLLVIYSLAAASVNRYNIYTRRFDPDWEIVRRWSGQHTAKSAKFITPPKNGNFRVLSLRTSINEDIGLIVWVDPPVFRRNQEYIQKVKEGYNGNIADLEYLFGLAKDWSVDFVIVKGAYKPDMRPIFQSGPFSILKVS